MTRTFYQAHAPTHHLRPAQKSPEAAPEAISGPSEPPSTPAMGTEPEAMRGEPDIGSHVLRDHAPVMPSAGDREAYARGMLLASKLHIDLAPFEIDADTTRADLLALSGRLEAAIREKQSAQTPGPAIMPANTEAEQP